MDGLWLIAGLGNPGPKYDRTRHNAGFWFLDALLRRHGGELRNEKKLHGQALKTRIDGIDAVLLAPGTFMNESGQSIRAAADFYRIPADRVLIAHDELDLPPGTARLKQGGGHGGHNGLRSTFRHLGTQDFWRLRIGIGHPGLAEQVTPWVLGRAPADDENAIVESIDRSVAVLPDFLAGRAGEAMKTLHARGRSA
ncbi:aminoacyl-tRNA hydrolase [Wenzhouxiangella sp. XN79A]|uniref:aminoacyl-tRNA hydrolase n=1 Tax=Wenzhouxiangella sp. XN79A TaxID=2724193 RepID=UPI00144A727C|nr:aminoacyl-tRNA hydrolase [Wenzhouxiangella sp. XN79A]NKI34103.1 aminoacyl-tRNA hydrolase [Wenzhouxiangella sp. XN79A]